MNTASRLATFLAVFAIVFAIGYAIQGPVLRWMNGLGRKADNTAVLSLRTATTATPTPTVTAAAVPAATSVVVQATARPATTSIAQANASTGAALPQSGPAEVLVLIPAALSVAGVLTKRRA